MKFLKYLLLLLTLLLGITAAINERIKYVSNPFIYKVSDKIPNCYTAIVLGALVNKSGTPSDYLQDRLDASIELYNKKKISRFLLSGDHGRINYDEVNTMKQYLITKGIDTKDIFMDHAGFDTYNTLVRAKEIFEVQDVIIISQEFHLARAIYIARNKGLTAYGMSADKRKYKAINHLKFREKLANIKAFGEVIFNKKPRFLGAKIPITGESSLSYD